MAPDNLEFNGWATALLEEKGLLGSIGPLTLVRKEGVIKYLWMQYANAITGTTCAAAVCQN